ncbi:hypothetical protein JK358_09825 [Nocardia sp. 2]|uniref:Low molecular weight antigen MTB12-like C-terminal domain-containing protein n=1 Tax=Nocardia acididurans TaxID=2802282 RepID=A0ABS1M3E3_9NOCA|nr:hypothetical protein [Nocardia acididurans]MBL1074695.1 hypothetical protein [Nocardia acididurans]
MVRKFVAASMSAAALLLPVSAAAVIAAPAAVAAPAAPSAGELQGTMQAALNGSGAALESGDASRIGAVKTRIAAIPGYSWSITGGVSVDGDVANATLDSRLGDYSYPIPVTFKYVDGSWKVSRETEDLLVSYASM